jgi:hypothetical protein
VAAQYQPLALQQRDYDKYSPNIMGTMCGRISVQGDSSKIHTLEPCLYIHHDVYFVAPKMFVLTWTNLGAMVGGIELLV